MPRLFILLLLLSQLSAAQQFTPHTIATGLRGGYQVVVADLNHDRKPDLLVVASGMSELLWFENPGWERHVIAGGLHAMINAAVYDIDGDAIPEIGLAHEFAMRADQSLGIVSILEHKGDPRGPWTVREIDRLPTSHRLRWADLEGDGKKVLVNAPLTGAESGNVPLVYYKPGHWKRTLIGDGNTGVMHGVYITDWDGNGRDSILTASSSGVLLYRHVGQAFQPAAGFPAGDPNPQHPGSSDIAVGRGRDGRFLATIEPWHGNQVVVYLRSGATWKRHVIDDTLDDTHSIVTADLDGDGRDELIVAQRGKPYRVLVYHQDREGWHRRVIEEGGISAASCAVADLNNDTRADLVCIGSTTANLKWYENTNQPK